MSEAARRACYVALAAVHVDALNDVLWRHFHGNARRQSPTFLDAVAVLRELGARPAVEIGAASRGARYRPSPRPCRISARTWPCPTIRRRHAS